MMIDTIQKLMISTLANHLSGGNPELAQRMIETVCYDSAIEYQKAQDDLPHNQSVESQIGCVAKVIGDTLTATGYIL